MVDKKWQEHICQSSAFDAEYKEVIWSLLALVHDFWNALH